MKLIFLLILALAIKGLNNHEQDMNHSLLKRIEELERKYNNLQKNRLDHKWTQKDISNK